MKKFYIGGIIACAIVVGAFWFSHEPTPPVIEEQPEFGELSIGDTFNLVGTSTTSPEATAMEAGGLSATTTNIVRMTDSVNLIDIVFNAVTASSSEVIMVEFLASNEDGCGVSGQTSWFSPVPEAGSVTAMVQAGQAAVTLAFTPGADDVQHNIQFTNWNYRCLRVDIRQASSTVWAHGILKSFN